LSFEFVRDFGFDIWNLSEGGLMPDIQSMIGKEVDVIANGMKYTGTLIEVSDVDVHLKSSMQWIALPASSVSSIKLKGAVERAPEREGHFQD
jgi:hypothetical protein